MTWISDAVDASDNVFRSRVRGLSVWAHDDNCPWDDHDENKKWLYRLYGWLCDL